MVIGGNIKVKVLKISDTSVSLGFEAPQNVPIMREELIGRSKQGKKQRGKKPI